MNLEQQLNDAIESQNALTQEVSGKMGKIDAASAALATKTDAAIADMKAWQAQLINGTQRNLLRDSGRFFNPDLSENASSNRRSTLGAKFGVASDMALINGTTVSDAGKFITSNATNGGSSGVALTEPVKALTDKMFGVGKARHGVEYYVAEFKVGENPASYPCVDPDGVTRYIVTMLTLPIGKGTFGAWLFAVSGTVSMYGATHRNGAQSNSPVVTVADGWVHLAATLDGGNPGYIMPQLRVTPDAVFRMALPVLLSGDQRGLVPKNPVLTQWY